MKMTDNLINTQNYYKNTLWERHYIWVVLKNKVLFFIDRIVGIIIALLVNILLLMIVFNNLELWFLWLPVIWMINMNFWAVFCWSVDVTYKEKLLDLKKSIKPNPILLTIFIILWSLFWVTIIWSVLAELFQLTYYDPLNYVIMLSGIIMAYILLYGQGDSNYKLVFFRSFLDVLLYTVPFVLLRIISLIGYSIFFVSYRLIIKFYNKKFITKALSSLEYSDWREFVLFSNK